MIYGIIAIVLWVVTVLGWVLYNLYTKNLKLENTVIVQAGFINNIQLLIQESDKVLKELDTKIWVEGDKELAVVFQSLKAIQETLNQYKGA
jgi:hypothetical protein